MQDHGTQTKASPTACEYHSLRFPKHFPTSYCVLYHILLWDACEVDWTTPSTIGCTSYLTNQAMPHQRNEILSITLSAPTIPYANLTKRAISATRRPSTQVLPLFKICWRIWKRGISSLSHSQSLTVTYENSISGIFKNGGWYKSGQFRHIHKTQGKSKTTKNYEISRIGERS